MIARFSPPGYRWLHFFGNVPVRVGLYTGVCLSLVFTGWILVANRLPLLEPLAKQRNIAATILLVLIAAMPVLRFLRSSADLLVSGLLAWSVLTLTYRILSFYFVHLEVYYSAFHVFVLGAIAYLLFATLSWVGIIIWRARTTQGTHTSR